MEAKSTFDKIGQNLEVSQGRSFNENSILLRLAKTCRAIVSNLNSLEPFRKPRFLKPKRTQP